MNVFAISSLLASMVILAIGASVLLRDRTRRTYTSFAAFTFMLSAWHLCTFIAMATQEPLVEWLALWPAATIPPVALRFFREFIAEPSIGGPRRSQRVSLGWTLIAYLVLIYAAIFRQPIHHEVWFQIPFGVYVYGSLYRCVIELYVQYRRATSRVARTRIRYLMLGGLVAITLALTDTLPRIGVAWPTLGNVLTILYLYFLSQTLFRYRLLDLHELIAKMVVLGTLVVLLWAVYGLLLAWVGAGQDGLFLLNALVASFVILILFEPIRSRLENTTNRWILRQKDELRGRLDAVRREVVNPSDLNDVVRRIMTAVGESRRITHACVYLIDPDGAGHDLVSFYGAEKPVERLDATEHRRFLERLRQNGHVDLESLRREAAALEGNASERSAREAALATIDALEAIRGSMAVPVLGTAETEQGPWLLGLIAVRDDRVEGAFDLDDIDAFRRLAGQITQAIESSQVYERVRERERLAAIGEMAAGLAHEIRNPLGAIKGAAQLLIGPDGKPADVTQETGDFLKIIVDEVNRLNNVVSQFLDYARPQRSDAGHAEVDVNDVVKRTVQLLETYDGAARVEVDVRLDDDMPRVVGDPEQLRQVFLNLGLNAIQAMEGSGGKLEIITTRRRRSRLGYGSFAEVRFRDSGVGIARDKLKNLFIPFYTTKPRGTGLGLAISQRIVNQHGGTIEVRSSPGKGSIFSVFLPAMGAEATVAEHDPHGSTTQPVTGFRAPRVTGPLEPPRPAAPAPPPSDTRSPAES